MFFDLEHRTIAVVESTRGVDRSSVLGEVQVELHLRDQARDVAVALLVVTMSARRVAILNERL